MLVFISYCTDIEVYGVVFILGDLWTSYYVLLSWGSLTGRGSAACLSHYVTWYEIKI